MDTTPGGRTRMMMTAEYIRKCASKKMCFQMGSEKWQCLDHPNSFSTKINFVMTGRRWQVFSLFPADS